METMAFDVINLPYEIYITDQTLVCKTSFQF